jgi:hypothetical protein
MMRLKLSKHKVIDRKNVHYIGLHPEAFFDAHRCYANVDTLVAVTLSCFNFISGTTIMQRELLLQQ